MTRQHLVAHKRETMELQACVDVLLRDELNLSNVDLRGKRVLYRVDLNVPLSAGGSVADATRLESIFPTLQLMLQKGARVVLASHLGRPQPSRQTAEEMQQRFSLAPVAAQLQQHLGPALAGLVPDCIGSAAAAAVQALQPGQVMMLVTGT